MGLTGDGEIVTRVSTGQDPWQRDDGSDAAWDDLAHPVEILFDGVSDPYATFEA